MFDISGLQHDITVKSELQQLTDFVNQHRSGLGALDDAVRELRRIDSVRNVLELEELLSRDAAVCNELTMRVALNETTLVLGLGPANLQRLWELTFGAINSRSHLCALEWLQSGHAGPFDTSRYVREPWYTRDGLDLRWLRPKSLWDIVREHERQVACTMASFSPERYKPPKSYDDKLKLILTGALLRVLSRWLQSLRQHVDGLRTTLLHHNLFGPRFTVSIRQHLG